MAKKAKTFFGKVLIAVALVVGGACVWAFLANEIKGAAESAKTSVQSQVSNGLNDLGNRVKP